MDQLLCRNLRAGDILLKMAGTSLSHRIIRMGQRLVGQPNAFLAHAAIALDTQFAIEAQKAGVTANHLAVQNKACGYIVYRCLDGALARGAAECAKLFLDIQGERGNLKYDTVGAGKSIFGGPGAPKTEGDMDAVFDDLLAGRGGEYFCSQFVVYVYQVAAAQSKLKPSSVFNVSDAKVSPSVLASLLQGNPRFQEAGYMMPGER